MALQIWSAVECIIVLEFTVYTIYTVIGFINKIETYDLKKMI